MTVTHHDVALEAETLIRDVLREGRPIRGEQPLVFDPAFDGRFVTIEAEGRVVSACGILPRDLIVAGGRVRIGLIGTVATHAAHRCKGYAGEILRRAENELAADGAMLSMLWADDADFYSSRGYIPIGTELDYAMARTQLQFLPPATGVRAAKPGDAPAIHALYCKHESRVARSLAETAALLAGPKIDALVNEADGSVKAYALVGRGEDLAGVLHEWGGELEHALAVFRAHLERLDSSRDGLFVMCPSRHKELRDYFEATRCAGMVGYLGMARLLDAGQAARVLSRHTPAEVHVRADGRGVLIEGPKGRLRLNDQETLMTLFPPKSARQVIDVVEREIGSLLPELPLLPFLWGLDSI